jgi:hypothetical protein
MSRPLELLTSARHDLEQAVAWYNCQVPGLGDSLLLHVDETLAWIERHPELYPIDFGSVRRALTRRFPYAVYYRVLANIVQVTAILDCRIDPAVHQTRAAAPDH